MSLIDASHSRSPLHAPATWWRICRTKSITETHSLIARMIISPYIIISTLAMHYTHYLLRSTSLEIPTRKKNCFPREHVDAKFGVGVCECVCLSSTPNPLHRTTEITNYFWFESNSAIATGMHSVRHRRPHSHTRQQSETLKETSLLRPLAHVSIIRVFYIECTLISNARCTLHSQQPLQCHHWRQTDNNNRSLAKLANRTKTFRFGHRFSIFHFHCMACGCFGDGSTFVRYWSEPTENGERYYSHICYRRRVFFDLLRTYYTLRCLAFCVCVFFFFFVGSFIASRFPIFSNNSFVPQTAEWYFEEEKRTKFHSVFLQRIKISFFFVNFRSMTWSAAADFDERLATTCCRFGGCDDRLLERFGAIEIERRRPWRHPFPLHTCVDVAAGTRHD